MAQSITNQLILAQELPHSKAYPRDRAELFSLSRFSRDWRWCSWLQWLRLWWCWGWSWWTGFQLVEVEEIEGVHARLSLSSLTCGRNRNEKLASFFSFLSDARCGSLTLSLIDDHEVGGSCGWDEMKQREWCVVGRSLSAWEVVCWNGEGFSFGRGWWSYKDCPKLGFVVGGGRKLHTLFLSFAPHGFCYQMKQPTPICFLSWFCSRLKSKMAEHFFSLGCCSLRKKMQSSLSHSFSRLWVWRWSESFALCFLSFISPQPLISR